MNPFRDGNEKKGFGLKFETDLLGTVPMNKELYAAHIIKKGKELSKNDLKTDEQIESEIETVEDIEEKGWTGFHKDDEGIFLYEHMIKGFLKSAYEVALTKGLISKVVSAGRKIDKLIIVEPRRIRLKKEPDGVFERPIRVMTRQGERVSVTRSDYVKAGTEIHFTIEVIRNAATKTSAIVDMEMISLLMQYGEICGLGQFRGSGGYGRFSVIE